MKEANMKEAKKNIDHKINILLIFGYAVIIGIGLTINLFYGLALSAAGLFFFIFPSLITRPWIWLVFFAFSYFIDQPGWLPIDLTPVALFISAVSVGVLIYSKKPSFSLSKVDIALIIFTLWLVFSWTISGADDPMKLLKIIFSVVLPYLLVRYGIRDRSDIRDFLILWLSAGALLALYTLTFIGAGARRLHPPNTNPIPVAITMSISLFILFYFMLSERRVSIQYKLALGFLAVPLAVVLFLSGRGAVIALMLSLFIFSVLRILLIKKRKLRRGIASSYAALIVIAISIAPVVLFPMLDDTRFEGLISGDDASIESRKVLIAESLEHAKDNPLTGIGVENQYPHNIFIEILSESGLIGLMMFLSFILLFFKQATNSFLAGPDGLSLVVLLIVLVLLIEAQFSFRLDAHKWLFMFMALFFNLQDMTASSYSRKTRRASR